MRRYMLPALLALTFALSFGAKHFLTKHACILCGTFTAHYRLVPMDDECQKEYDGKQDSDGPPLIDGMLECEAR